MSNAFTSFFGGLISAFSKLFGKAAPVATAISSAVNYIAPFVTATVTIIDPEAGAVLLPIMDKITVGLAALKVTAADATTPEGKANVLSILASLSANASDLETAFQVKNPDTAAKITALVTLINSEVQAIGAGLK